MVVEMCPVQSSNVESVGYDTDACELHVRFLSSPIIYVYQGVPPEVHEELMSAGSKGNYVNTHIKPVYLSWYRS